MSVNVCEWYVNEVAVCWVVYGCRSRAGVFIIKLSRAFTLCIDIRDTITFTIIIIWGRIVNLPLDRIENRNFIVFRFLADLQQIY